MARDLKASLVIAADDKASAVLRRVSGDAARQAERTVQRSARASEAGQRAQERAAVRQRTADERATRAREQLGIRSERAIRREIQLTEAAYNRLARSGRASTAEQSRAYAQMQQRVAGLRQEMAGLERQQRRGAGSMVMRVGAMAMQAGAAGAAGAAVLARPIGRTMDYDQRLRYMSNTAFGDNGRVGRQEGYEVLKAAIQSTLDTIGGNRDEAAAGLSSLLNAGVVGGEAAMQLLPTVQKVAIGSDASTDDVAQLVNALVKTGGIAVDDVPQALDMFVAAAKEGAIEFRDLAKGMPQILAAAQGAGMTGIRDLPFILSIVEGSMATAGSADQGMNNVFNWFGKMNSQDAIRAAEKIEWSPGKSIDLVGQLAQYRDEGLNTAQAYDQVVNRIVQADPNIARLEKQLQQANPQDRQAILESQYALFEGSAISQLLPDRQALMGYLSYRYTSADERGQMVSSITNSRGAADEDWSFIAESASFKTQQAKNQWQAAEFEAFKGLSDQLGNLAGKTAELAAEYPNMAQAVVAVTSALTALAAVAGSAALLNTLRTRGAGGAAAGGAGAVAAGAAGAAAAARAVGGQSVVMRSINRVGVGGPLVVAGASYGAYQTSKDDSLTSDQKTDQYVELGTRAAGAWAGMKAGAVTGSWFGPWGTVVGGITGGLGGDYLGEALAQFINDLRNRSASQPEPSTLEQALSGPPQSTMTQEQLRDAVAWGQREANKEPRKLEVEVTVDVRNGNIAAEVERVFEREARRH